jgi:DNA modification methylase
MRAYYEQGGVTIYHGDSREFTATGVIGAVVTDPPYGINWKPRVNNRDSSWTDADRESLTRWLSFPRVCVWGGNYYTDQLPPSESWLIWLKRPAGFDNDPRSYAVLEMAWTNYGSKPRTMTHVWDGGKRAGAAVNRAFLHPAQKPLEVMRWSILEAGSISGAILDPFMGSGTTLEAAKVLGHQAIGIELDESYCEIAARRLEQDSLLGLLGDPEGPQQIEKADDQSRVDGDTQALRGQDLPQSGDGR